MRTTAAFFPFDLFGSPGTAAGADLLAEALEELLADNAREQAPTRAAAYAGLVRVRRFAFETVAAYRDWRGRGRRAVHRALAGGDFLLWVTGNHLGVLPVYEELAGGGRTLVVQLDAHLDVQSFSDQSPEPSHANFLLHCPRPLPAVVNVGHRDLLLPDAQVGAYYRRTFPADELAADPGPALRAVRRLAKAATRVFLDIDCDVLDPAYFPAVAHPVPFGLTPGLLLRFVDAAHAGPLAGVAISEFDPGRDVNDRCLATLAWLLEYLLLRRYEQADSERAPSGPSRTR